MKLPVQNIKLTLAISWAILSCTQVQAQSVNSLQPLPPDIGEPRADAGSLIFASPPPPPDIGEPGRRADAGSRGCEEINKPLTSGSQKQLTALVPLYSDSKLVLGRTSATHPTFWFYVPYQPPFPGKFVLRDKDDKLVYQTDVILPKTPGVVSFLLPSTVAPLEIGKQYHWYLKIYCQSPENLSAFIDGWIQRNSLNPSLKSQLEKATPQERVTLYAANGIWFEALSTAGEMRRRDPKDTNWAALLQAVRLNDLANEPIVNAP